MNPPYALSRRGLLLGAASLGVVPACAQSYPARPITLVVTFAAGGGVDTVSRLFAESLAGALKGKMIVENRAGGGTIIGTQAVVSAAADGYTLLAAPTTMVINPAVRPNMPFNWQSDLVPVGLMAKLPFVAVTRNDSPISSMQDIVKLSKARENPFFYASGGTGTVAHLAGELFALQSGARMQHVAYRGEGPAVLDVLGGTLDVTFATLASVAEQIKAKSLKALAITSLERAGLLPDVPTVAEQGFPGFDVSAWVGLVAPKGIPTAVISELQGALRASLEDKPLIEKLEKIGAVPAAKDFAFEPFMAREAETWARVIRDAKITF